MIVLLFSIVRNQNHTVLESLIPIHRRNLNGQKKEADQQLRHPRPRYPHPCGTLFPVQSGVLRYRRRLARICRVESGVSGQEPPNWQEGWKIKSSEDYLWAALALFLNKTFFFPRHPRFRFWSFWNAGWEISGFVLVEVNK